MSKLLAVLILFLSLVTLSPTVHAQEPCPYLELTADKQSARIVPCVTPTPVPSPTPSPTPTPTPIPSPSPTPVPSPTPPTLDDASSYWGAFNSASGYQTTPDSAAISAGNIDFTFAVSKLVLNSKGSTQAIFAKGDVGPGDARAEYILSYNASRDRFRFAVGNGTVFAEVFADNAGSPVVGTEYSILVWHDTTANLIGISVNNGTANTASFSAGSHDSTSNFIMGAITVNGAQLFPLNGSHAGVGMWKRLLTSAEKSELPSWFVARPAPSPTPSPPPPPSPTPSPTATPTPSPTPSPTPTPSPPSSSSFVPDFYVATNGSSSGTGTKANPWNLSTALNKTGVAGKTICLGDGVYEGVFTSTLTGTTSAPVIVRSCPGEWAIIDSGSSANRTASALTVNGSDTWYRDFEARDTSLQRNGKESRATSINVFGPRTKFINMVVHDGQQGFGFWKPAIDSELYGNLIFNCSVLPRDSTDIIHGHCIYSQNDTGLKRIVDNIMFSGLRRGIQIYTENSTINNYHIEGNTITNFNEANILVGGTPVARNITKLDNISYFPANGIAFKNYGNGADNCAINNNYFIGSWAMQLNCTNVQSISGNSLMGQISGFTQAQYPNNTYKATRPTTGLEVFIRPNQYEAGRANITVLNWARANTVSVNLSSAGLTNGQQYEIRNAFNYFGAPVMTFTYNASAPTVTVSMNSPEATAVQQPIGLPARATTLPEFGLLVVQRKQ